MTTGSWTVGSDDLYNSTFFGKKEWVGQDGRYEPYDVGVRSKWNNYSMTYQRWTQDISNPNSTPYPGVNYTSASAIKGVVGWSANDELRTLNKLAERIRGHSFDLGINLAEANKSYATILKNVRSIGSALLSLKHGNVPEALRTLGSNQRSSKRVTAKDLSGRWLETQYAFLPLVDQSYQASKALAANTGPRKKRFNASSGAKRKRINISPTSSYRYWVNYTYSMKLIAELYEDLSLSRSLGLTNPAAILWEVVPYSFVVDWFLPIGSYLSALGVIPALQGRFLTITRAGGKSAEFQSFSQFYPDRNMKSRVFALDRVVSSALTVPNPTFNKLPRALSPKRLVNAVALIHQRLR